MAANDSVADVLLRRVIGIADATLRADYVRHSLRSMDPALVAEVFLVARSGAEARRAAHVRLLQAVMLALAHVELASLRDAVRDALVGRGQEGIALALYRAPDPEDDVEALRVPDFGAGRTLTLGERQALARRRDRDLIAKALRDPHPDVIRILLGNPALRETDVVLLSARRPVVTEVLREVFRHPRWIAREAVRVALVLNPGTPLDVALQLAPLLRSPDLRRACTAADLAPETREACRKLLDREGEATLH